MTRRAAMAAVAGGALRLPAARANSRKPGEKPNLLFFLTDQQRADTMAAYGNPRFRVPALNGLAAQSVVFDRAYVTQPVCTPSRSSIMTGLWPHQNGCVRNLIPLRRGAKTVPELLNDPAYKTAYMGKWHLGDEAFAQHGFQEWQSMEDAYGKYAEGRDPNQRTSYTAFLIRAGYKPNARGAFGRELVTKLPVDQSKPSFLAMEASQFILRNRDAPWMLYVSFLEPHPPYSSALDDLHTEEEAQLPRNYPGLPVEGEPEPYKVQRESDTGLAAFDINGRADLLRVTRNYAGLCSLVDQAVGRILWALQASGQMGNTVVVFTSDHGDMLGSHSLVAKQVMYEESIRVPLLVRAPFHVPTPQRVAQPVSHIDLVPTVLDLLGRKETAQGLPGESMAPLMAGKARPASHVFLEWTRDDERSTASSSGRTVISPDGHKLAVYETGGSLLLDRNRDPWEMRNVYGKPEYAGVQKKLESQLAAWRKRSGDL